MSRGEENHQHWQRTTYVSVYLCKHTKVTEGERTGFPLTAPREIRLTSSREVWYHSRTGKALQLPATGQYSYSCREQLLVRDG
jgi:hypothetical protein